MKTKPLFVGDWAKLSEKQIFEDLKESWEASDSELQGFQILVAYQGEWNWEGSAWLLLKRGRELFEVHGSHCSFYGFEGQFKPGATSKEYLLSDKFRFYSERSECEEAKTWMKNNL